MPQENCQKIKLLKIMEILRQETDEDHPLKTGEICDRLVAMGITCDRRTLHRDMKLLNDFGYEVMSPLIGHERAYYVEDRSFSVPELKILIDAVQAASFITEKKTTELIDKIAALGGGNRAAILKDNIVHFNQRKHRNESIYYNVDELENAIQKNKKVIFRYFDLDENGQRVYRKDGHHYIAEPVALVFSEDNYYLISYNSKHEATTNYRVDRMDNVESIDDAITDKAKILRGSVSGYTDTVFKMFNGPTKTIMLQFDNSLLGAMYDKFGENIKIQRVNDLECSVEVTVQISPTFRGWLYQFGNKMRITEPEE